MFAISTAMGLWWFVFVVAALLMCATTYFAWLFGHRYGSDLQKPYLADDEIPGTCAGCAKPFGKAVTFGVGAKVCGAFFMAVGVYCMFYGVSGGGNIVAQCAATSSIDISLLGQEDQQHACSVGDEVVDFSMCDQ
jgi:hypothetical protein